MQHEHRRWWHETTIYQVYPRSFSDSNGDGIGDLTGVIDHLDHIVDLGIGTVWLSPFFDSPQEDFGYDISDYCDVAPEYGSLDDAQRLIDECHARGLKVMFDMVMNHTSDQHPWFRMSKASRSNAKSDWYIWRDGRGKGGRRPPNNWRSAMEVKTAWQWGPDRQQWFLASFLGFQPDLNYRNPEVREAMFDAVRFWLRRGVDGFRLDIFGNVMKDTLFRDNPFGPKFGGSEIARIWRRTYTENTDDNIAFAKDLRAVVDEFTDVQAGPSGSAGAAERVLLGEVFGSPQVLRRYMGDDDGLHLVFLFDFLAFKYSAGFFRSRIEEYEANYPAPLLPTYVLENHDRSRSIDRVGGSIAKAKTLAVMLCTLRGIPTIYQGQEIAMTNTAMRLREARDPIARTYFSWVPEAVVQRLPERLNRDEVRTPMQWTSERNAGFTRPDAHPWLPVNANHRTRNVQAQTGDPDSPLETYRTLLSLRRERPSLHSGSLRLLDGDPSHPEVLAYVRVSEGAATAAGESTVVVINFDDSSTTVSLAALGGTGSDLSILTTTDEGAQLRGLELVIPACCGVVLGSGPVDR